MAVTSLVSSFFISDILSENFLSMLSLNSDKSVEILSTRLAIPSMVASAASNLRLMFSICHISPAGVLLSLRSKDLKKNFDRITQLMEQDLPQV